MKVLINTVSYGQILLVSNIMKMLYTSEPRDHLLE